MTAHAVTPDFLARMADVLVRDLDFSERDAEHAGWLETLSVHSDDAPEVHRTWLEFIARDRLQDAVLAFVDTLEVPPESTYEECKARVDEHVRPLIALIAELRGTDVGELRRVEGWAD